MFCSGPLAGHTTSDILLSVEEVSHKPFRFFWVGVGEWGVVVGWSCEQTFSGDVTRYLQSVALSTAQQSLRSAGIGVVWMMTSSAPERCEYTAAASVLTSQNCGLDSFIG